MTTSRFACPCCRFLTLEEAPPGTFIVCPVCDWEDDDEQFSDPTLRDGANTVCLAEARVNFLRFGASTKEAVGRVRAAKPEETSSR